MNFDYHDNSTIPMTLKYEDNFTEKQIRFIFVNEELNYS